jgi:type I site-specific restriction-modification system R (restriction) subunit
MTEQKPVKIEDTLDENSRDVGVAIAKGLAGIAPGIGAMLAEMVVFTIPGQRVDRVVDFVRKLAIKVENHEKMIQKMQTPEGADLIEEALVQASRASTDERREYIANLLRNSLTREEMEHDEKKKLFNLFSQLTDHEIIFLKNYSLIHTIGNQHPFFKKHYAILRPITKTLGRSEEDNRKDALQESYKITLNNLRLVQPKGNSLTTTPLGNLLLDYIEVPDGSEESLKG